MTKKMKLKDIEIKSFVTLIGEQKAGTNKGAGETVGIPCSYGGQTVCANRCSDPYCSTLCTEPGPFCDY
jgi:hypothetical protein